MKESDLIKKTMQLLFDRLLSTAGAEGKFFVSIYI